ncbi:CRISPR-associated DxTHG motif protein [Dolichospermum sp. UHCC 0260]|nr:CRISPR-associated DxTHG motif protein [Dolichospermum sp. UHCC 0299]MTJ20719.1 CRISPR-associated DxTHG motif protein [Dolichospermum sp. UHCC 0352]MTJ34095.1 CRISPR-associated DxTHG motif protein [Dolichospermum sp. UHCC 0260]MTJ39144.1 CRISPR-associated DxTHG motif protein [Dolichospermum sp. UHCC 0406]
MERLYNLYGRCLLPIYEWVFYSGFNFMPILTTVR